MADPVPAPGGPKKAKKKIPTWGWVAGGAGLVVLYYFYSKKKAANTAAASSAATSAAAPTSTGATSGTTSSGYGPPTGGGYTGPIYYPGVPSTTSGNTSGNNSGGVASSPPASPVGALSGSGYLPTGATVASIPNNPGTDTATSSTGQVYTWLSPAQFAGYTGPVFYEPVPGTFVPWSKTLGVLPNTPLYAQGGTPAATTAAGSAAAGAA